MAVKTFPCVRRRRHPGRPDPHSPERNPGTPLELDWVREVRVNTSAAERRAATLPKRRTVKKEWQAAWYLRRHHLHRPDDARRATTPRAACAGCAPRRASPVRRTSWRRSASPTSTSGWPRSASTTTWWSRPGRRWRAPASRSAPSRRAFRPGLNPFPAAPRRDPRVGRRRAPARSTSSSAAPTC